MSRLLGLGSLTLTLSLAACDAEDQSTEAALDEAAPAAIVPVAFDVTEAGDSDADEGSNVVAEVTFGEGASVRFIDESVGEDPSVGMLVIGAPGLLAEVREQELSPLEVHLALAPELEAPALLWDHHLMVAESQGRVSLEPHAGATPTQDILANPLAALSTASMSGCKTSVQPDAPTWADLWCPNIPGGYDACGSGITDGTNYVYTGTAGDNFLGACTSGTSLTFRVERELTAGVWSLVTSTTLAVGGHYAEYESDDNFLLNYRSKLTPASSTVDYQWGAARD